GIADCFRTITDSGIVGHEKPHPRIFETALASVGAQPAESLYVGDVYAVDYRGATGAGMEAVLFDVCGAYFDKGLPRVETLEELIRLLGWSDIVAGNLIWQRNRAMMRIETPPPRSAS